MATPDKKRRNQKGRVDRAPFLKLRWDIIDSENFQRLSGIAVKLLVFLARQYRGNNNGDLSATWKMVKDTNTFASKSTLFKALAELEHYGMIVKTRQGRRDGGGICNLYALTWEAIDHCPARRTNAHKLDVQPTVVPSNEWRTPVEVPFERQPKNSLPSTQTVPTKYRKRTMQEKK